MIGLCGMKFVVKLKLFFNVLLQKQCWRRLMNGRVKRDQIVTLLYFVILSSISI